MSVSSTGSTVALSVLGFLLLINAATATAQSTGVIPTAGAPSARYLHTAVWTGSEMIVWGGQNNATILGDGARYNPTTQTWTPVSNTGAPSPRTNHSAIWTGSEMVVFGGWNGLNHFSNGARYNPATDTWIALPVTNAPAARKGHGAVWTGSKMVIWGGDENYPIYPAGAVWDSASNTWTAVTTTAAPANRYYPRPVWTGTEMFIWGGDNGFYRMAQGGLFAPTINTWRSVSTTGQPNPTGESAKGMANHSAVWTGSKVLILGGVYGTGNDNFAGGGIYDPQANSWSALTNIPGQARRGHAAVWADDKMVVWGGYESNGDALNDGAIYNPATNTWTLAPTAPSPSVARAQHSIVWTGSAALVWGGETGNEFNAGVATNTGFSIQLASIITGHPQSLTVNQGQPASFNVSAVGSGSLFYQWQKDGVDIPGATSPTYAIPDAQPWHIGDYTVKVTDTNITVMSNSAVLSINDVNSGVWRGLMAYYSFDGSIEDKTPFARHLTNTGATQTNDRTGNVTKAAYAFDGTGSKMVAVGYKGVTGTSARTISLWIKPADTNGGCFLGYGTPTWEVSDRGADFRLKLGALNSEIALDSNWVGSSGSFAQPLTSGIWRHLVVVVPEGGVLSAMTYYLDGTLITSSSTTGKIPLNLNTSASVDLTIGGEDDHGVFQGMISSMDDVRIYNRALSSADVQQLLAYEDPDTDGDGIRDRFETGTGIYVSPTDTGTNPNVSDTDGDGLSDGQEVNLYGSNPNIVDTDGDGFGDGFEVFTGFNPSSAASTPEAQSSLLTAVEFRFNAANGLSYRIESSTDLNTWSQVESPVIGTGGTIVRYYSIEGQAKRFFRARRN